MDQVWEFRFSIKTFLSCRAKRTSFLLIDCSYKSNILKHDIFSVWTTLTTSTSGCTRTSRSSSSKEFARVISSRRTSPRLPARLTRITSQIWRTSSFSHLEDASYTLTSSSTSSRDQYHKAFFAVKMVLEILARFNIPYAMYLGNIALSSVPQTIYRNLAMTFSALSCSNKRFIILFPGR